MQSNLARRLDKLRRDPRLNETLLFGTAYTITTSEFSKEDWEKVINLELPMYGRTAPDYVNNAFSDESKEAFLERIGKRRDTIIALLLRTPLTEWPENRYRADFGKEYTTAVMDMAESDPNLSDWLIDSFKPGGANALVK